VQSPNPAPRLIGRWNVDGNGRLVLEWTLPAQTPDLGSIANEEAMPDLDDVPSTERGVRLQGLVA
jgi:hypothetical protein